jgi:hypothetical protein
VVILIIDTHSSYIINNTLNHVELIEKLNGCGKQPKDYVKSDNKDLLFNSNLGEIKTLITQELFIIHCALSLSH